MAKKTEEKIDTIGRDEVINNIMNIIETVSANKGNTTFALDGVWGSGKTFVLEKLEKRLSNCPQESGEDNKYFVIHYNCWKYDYYEEPLIAIVSSVLETLNEEKFALNNEQRASLKTAFKGIGNFILDLVNIPVKACLGFDAKKAAKQTSEFLKGEKKNREENNKYDDYFDLKRLLNKITKGFKDITEKQTVVLVIDELDRCLPEYAIKVLERLHHITDSLENIVTIIGTDEEKLYSIVERIFGYKQKDCTKYLKKFIKFSIQLAIGTAKDCVVEKYHSYIDLFDDSKWHKKLNFTDFYNVLFNGIDVREQENLMGKVLLMHSLITKEIVDISVMYTEMILIIMEHYYKVPIPRYFYNGKFNDSEGYPDLDEINTLFTRPMLEFATYTTNNFFIIDNNSGGNGLPYWYFSALEAEENGKPIETGKVRIQDRYYTKYGYDNYGIVKKFKDFIKTIK